MLTPPGLVRGRGRVSPSSDFDFSQGVLPGAALFTRASVAAIACNRRGLFEEVAADVPRFVYDRALDYNGMSDPWFDGFVVGAAAPVFARWGGGGAAWTNTVIAKGTTSDGLPFVTVRGQATPVNVNTIGFNIGSGDAAAGQPCSLGDVISGWGRVRLDAASGGVTLGSGFPAFRLYEAQATFLTAQNTTIASSMNVGEWYEGGTSRTVTNANAVQAALSLQAGPAVVGVPVDITATVVFPVVSRTAAPLTDTVSVQTLAARVGLVQQYGLQGILLEETATNEVSIARLDGAVAGTPGTPPTGLGSTTTTGNGLTRTISLGVEDGIPWVGFRFAGTVVATANVLISVSPIPLIVAAPGDVVTASPYVDCKGPALPAGVPFLFMASWNGAPLDTGFAALAGGSTFGRCRTPGTLTCANVGTTAFNAFVVVPCVAAEVVDFTVRIGFLQQEVATYPSSVVLPPVAAPAVAVRARDALSFPGIGPLDGAVLSYSMRFSVEHFGGSVATGASALFLAVLNSYSDCMRIWNGGSFPTLQKRVAATQYTNANAPVVTSGQFVTGAFAIDGASLLSSWDGAAVVTDATPGPALAPLATVRLNGGQVNDGWGIVCRFLRIWDGRKLSEAQVRAEAGRTS